MDKKNTSREESPDLSKKTDEQSDTVGRKTRLFDFDDKEIQPGPPPKPRKARKRKTVESEPNPFSSKWEFPVRLSEDMVFIEDKIEPIRIDLISEKDFESIQQGNFRPYLIDDSHVRIFQTKNNGFRRKVYSMKGGEAVLLFYILMNLEPGDHSIVLKADRVSKILSINRSTFFNHINTLIYLKIISRGETANKYYINIQILCAGTRAYSFPSYCVSNKGENYEDMKQKTQERARKVFQIRKSKRSNK